MSGELIAGLTGLVVALGTAFGAWRALRSDRATEREKRQASQMLEEDKRQANLQAVSDGLMNDLREDVRRLREERDADRKAHVEELKEMRKQAAEACERAERAEQVARECKDELRSLRFELTETRRQRDELSAENTVLRAKVARLEERVQELERHGGTGRTPPDGTPAVR